MILEMLASGPANTNGILIGCSQTRKAALIDAPLGGESFRVLRAQELSLSIEKLLLTHTHWDHIAEAASLKRDLSIPIWVHQEDAKNLQEPGADGLPIFCHVEPAQPDHFLQDGERFYLGKLLFEVVYTPGHSPGSICFFLPKEKILISGDVLFRGAIGNISFPTSNPAKMVQTLQRLMTLPHDTRVIPGHGEETTIGEEINMMEKHIKQLVGGKYD
ncbi:MAG: MBL fold metallo-hydrolase [Chlamydiae bacterium]|nr:MBL fold metallo-hydrolase [Chlamydiota bacterium]